MIIGLGLDLVELSRFEGVLRRHGPRLLARLFTDGERSAAGASGRSTASLAARFAAKEAALKALGTGRVGSIHWRDVEVTGSAPPGITLHGTALSVARSLGVRRLHLSLSHETRHAAAVVILEGEIANGAPASG